MSHAPIERSTPAGYVGEFGVALRYGVPVETVIFWARRGLLPKHRRTGSTGRKIWAVAELPSLQEMLRREAEFRDRQHESSRRRVADGSL